MTPVFLVHNTLPYHNPTAATGHSTTATSADLHPRNAGCMVDVHNDPKQAHTAAFVPSRVAVNQARWPPLLILWSLSLILMGLKCCLNG